MLRPGWRFLARAFLPITFGISLTGPAVVARVNPELIVADAEGRTSVATKSPDCRIGGQTATGDVRTIRCADVAGPEFPTETWIEQPPWISSHLAHLDSSRFCVTESSSAIVPAVAEGHWLRLLRLGVAECLGTLQLPFQRRFQAKDAGAVVPLPAGDFLALLNDARGRITGVSHPTRIAGNTQHRFKLETAKQSGTLVVTLDFPHGVEDRFAKLVVLDDSSSMRPPDAVAISRSGVVAIWYALTMPTARVALRSSKLAWSHRDIQFHRGTVTHIDGRASPLPSLDVIITAPDTLQETATLFITRQDGGTRLADREGVTAGSHRFDALPPEPLLAHLLLGEWHFTRRVDLSEGDGKAIFELRPIALHGRVLVGDDPSAATIRLSRGHSTTTQEAGEDGKYEALLWEPGRYSVRITVEGRASEFTELVRIDGAGQRDFHIPNSRHVIHITDAETGKDVEGATVSFANTWTSITGEQQRIRQQVSASKGSVELPPLRPGSLELRVFAKGYSDYGPADHEVVASGTHTIPVSLSPDDGGMEFTIRLPSGTPAAGAEFMLYRNDGSAAFATVAGHDGRVTVPRGSTGDLVVVRHADAASTAMNWLEAKGRRTWDLEQSAEPLVVRVERADGAAVPFAPVALLVNGIRLAGLPLAAFTASPAGTDHGGMWTARNLPRGAVSLIAAERSTRTPIESGAWDALATTVSYPWPSTVRLRALH